MVSFFLKNEASSYVIYDHVICSNLAFVISTGICPQVVKLIATHCMNALHCILATRNMTTMLTGIRDADQQAVSYSKKLPRTLINAIGKAQSFHSARLSDLSGANVEIKNDDLLLGT